MHKWLLTELLWFHPGMALPATSNNPNPTSKPIWYTWILQNAGQASLCGKPLPVALWLTGKLLLFKLVFVLPHLKLDLCRDVLQNCQALNNVSLSFWY